MLCILFVIDDESLDKPELCDVLCRVMQIETKLKNIRIKKLLSDNQRQQVVDTLTNRDLTTDIYDLYVQKLGANSKFCQTFFTI